MKKAILAGVLTAALAFGGGAATPARANDEDVAKAIAAIAAIALIGAAINNRNDRRSPPQPRLEALPSRCVIETWDNRGPGHALDARCLTDEMRHVDRLPANCRTQVTAPPWQDRNRTQRRGRDQNRSRHTDHSRAAYDIDCLARAGYRFDR